MPFYVYRCAEGHEFEAFQRMSEEPLEVCPKPSCGKKVERLIGATAGKVVGGTPIHHARAPRR